MRFFQHVIASLKTCYVHLNSLNLSDQNLTDADIIELCDFLAEYPSLEVIDLSRNQFGDIGAQALANTKIKYLLARGNKVSDAGALALDANTYLIVLELTGNNLSSAVARKLEQNITRKRFIRNNEEAQLSCSASEAGMFSSRQKTSSPVNQTTPSSGYVSP